MSEWGSSPLPTKASVPAHHVCESDLWLLIIGELMRVRAAHSIMCGARTMSKWQLGPRGIRSWMLAPGSIRLRTQIEPGACLPL